MKHLSALALVLLAGAPALGQEIPAAGPAAYTIFLRGQQIGREQASLTRTPDGWKLSSTSNMPEFENRMFEVRYAPDWQPIELRLDTVMRGKSLRMNTSFGLTSAISEITQDGTTTQKTDTISARPIVLPNNLFVAYEALAARLATAEVGAQFPAYIAPQAEIVTRVEAIDREQIQSTGVNLAVRKFRMTFQNPSGPLEVNLWVDERGRLARLEIPAVTLQVVREELSSTMTRFEIAAHPGDEQAMIPAAGFSLAATVTRPVGQQQKLRFPAVILVSGSGPHDRNETLYGIPIFGQVAGGLADAGFLVVRYDKRGVAQSGGRSESATLTDYMEDLRAVVRYVSRRDDVDKKRIAVLGHSEGGSVALLAASRDKTIAALVLVAAPGTTGADLILEQQQHALERSKLPENERAAKVDLQKKIQAAVLTGKGWEGIPEDLRQAADSAWFRSVLAFDPAKVMKDTRQPILVLQGALDTQVPPHHAEKLAELARSRKKGQGAALTVVEGINHLLVPATTGEVDEYGTLKEKQVSPKMIDAVVGWLRETI